MKRKLVQFALGVSLVGPLSFLAQDGRLQPCNTYAAMEEFMATYPDANKIYAKNLEIMKQEALNNGNAKAAAVVYTVPVVFHVLHQGGSENISDAQAIAALAQVNKDYARQGADVNTIAAPFQSIYIDSEIKFMLAHKDPQGNCCTGINHIYDSRTEWKQADVTYYNGLLWDPSKYLNIIIVRNIIPTGTVVGGGIIVGYTRRPPQTSAAIDCIVYRNNFLGGLDARSLSHEIGHWLNLDHTFGQTNNPGVTCGDDGINDTPPTKGNYGVCPTSLSGNTCAGSGQHNVENIMDYSTCPKNFTSGQTTVMRATLVSAVANRDNLSKPANLIATDVDAVQPCAPIADFSSANNSYTVCSGQSLQMKDCSFNGTITSYQFSANGGAIVSNASTTLASVMFPTVGTVTVSLLVTNGQGSSTRDRIVYVLDGTPGMVGPVIESFENGSLPAGWSIINKNLGSKTWSITVPGAAYHGQYCYMIEGATIGGNQEDVLQTSVIDLAATPGAQMEFAISYAQKSNTHKDALRIEASKDCGGTWGQITELSANQMQLNTGGINPTPFSPSIVQEWKTYNLTGYPSYNTYATSSSVIFRFTFIEAPAGQGNNIYFDAINLFNTPDGLNELSRSVGFNLFPNPSTGEAKVSLHLNDAADVTVNVVDVLGKNAVPAIDRSFSAGDQSIALNQDGSLRPGIYFVNLSYKGAKMSKKLIIQ